MAQAPAPPPPPPGAPPPAGPTPTPTPIGAILALVGGVVALISTFLAWFDFGVQGLDNRDLKGTELVMGLGTIFFAVLVIVFAAVAWVRSRVGRGRGWAIAALVFAALILIVGAYAAFAPEQAITQFEASDVAEDLGISEAEAEVALEQGFETGALSATSQIGTYVALIGGLLATVGSIMAIAAARRRTATA